MNRLPNLLVSLLLTAAAAAQSADLLVTPPDLLVFVAAASRVDRGLPYELYVSYRNIARTAADAAKVTVSVGAGRITKAPEGCTIDGPTATCEVGPLAPVDVDSTQPGPFLRFEAVAPDANNADITISASIATSEDNDLSNNQDSETIRTYHTILVVNTNDGGSGSLRAAIDEALGNGSSGVYIEPGGSGTDLSDNYIGFNGHYGLSMARGTVQVQATYNSFQANGNLAIDHGLDDVSPSVPDVGERPGNVLYAPVLLSARFDAASNTTIVEGTVQTQPSQGFRLWGFARTPETQGSAGGYATNTSEFSRTIEVSR